VLRAYSEALFIPLLLIVCLLLTARRETPTLRRAALAGVFLGLAILVRSTALLLPGVLPLWLLLRRPWRESWRAAVVLGAVSGLVVMPWVVRNEAVMHSAVLSTNGGYTLRIGDRLPPAPGHRHPRTWAITTSAAEVHQNANMTKQAVSFMLRHSGTWLGRVPGKFEALMGWIKTPILNAMREQKGRDPRGRWWYPKLSPAESALMHGALRNTWIFTWWHYTFWVLGGIALVLSLWFRRPTAGISVLLVAFWIVFHSVFFYGDVRFMISVTPLVAPALAWMIVRAATGGWRAAAGAFGKARLRFSG
jgi:hypothetical protein